MITHLGKAKQRCEAPSSSKDTWEALSVCWRRAGEGHLRLYISIVVVLEQQSRSFGVIFAGCDVERRKTYFPFSVILQEQRDHLIVTLLQCYSQRSEAILQAKKNTPRQAEQHGQ